MQFAYIVMKVILCLVFLLGLQNYCFSQEIKEKSSSKIVFPKDRKVAARIIGGEVVPPNAYPFQVALWMFGVSTCGGTLISTVWVLTAAHCFERNPYFVVIVMGDVMLTNQSTKPTTVIMVSTKFIVHEEFYHDDYNIKNDIALIMLPKSVELSQHVSTVTYSRGNTSYARNTGTTLGWGLTKTLQRSNRLRKLSNTILSNNDCRPFFPFTDIGPGHLCLSGEGNVGTCSGDSGGPLLVNDEQVGISSFGIEDCLIGAPSVFTRTAHFHDWIEKHSGIKSRSYRNMRSLNLFSLLCLVYLCTIL